MKEIIVATNNKHKAREISEIFDNVKAVPLFEAGIDVDVEETGATFEENALIKARTIYAMTHKPVLGDDSGLTVRALGGRPGIFSARFAGEHGNTPANNAKLLKEMEGEKDRFAEYVCAVAFVCDKGEFVVTGRAQGEILLSPRGEGGFGYDPLFLSSDLKRTFAEVSEEEKNAVSHRARALMELKSVLSANGIVLSE